MTALIATAERIIEKLDGYPVVNEDDWSNLEYSEYGEAFDRDAHSEFARALRDELSDAAIEVIEAAPLHVLQEWFEAQIPSGEYQTDGYPNFRLAFDRVKRDSLAALLNQCRSARKIPA